MKSLKTLGVIGGLSPASTSVYYEMINRIVNERLGGNASAPMLIYSVNFEEIAQYQHDGDWQSAGQMLADIAKKLEQAGADGILLATNTMHKVADAMMANITVPFLHIADITAQVILAQGIDKVALLGTAFTMQEAFYKDRFAKFGICCLVPNQAQIADIHRIIYEELTLGIINPDSKQRYLDIIATLEVQGVQGVVLGCTEIGLLIGQDDVSLPIFDTAILHAKAGAGFVLGE